MNNTKKLIGEYLIADHLINQEQLERALETQAASIQGGKMPLIGTLLAQMGALGEQDLAFALEEQERDRMRMRA